MFLEIGESSMLIKSMATRVLKVVSLPLLLNHLGGHNNSASTRDGLDLEALLGMVILE